MSRMSCIVRAAYCMTWTVSTLEMSSKNQPSLVKMSIACRSISRSLRTRDLVLPGEGARDVTGEEGFDGCGRPVEDDLDVVVPDRPRVRREDAEARLEDRRGLGAQPVHRLPERGSPLLVPAGVRAGAGTAVAPPALDAVAAAPGGVLDDLHLVGRREPLQVIAVDRDLRELVLLDVLEGVGQGHVAEAVVVPVGLAVGRDVDELGAPSLPRRRPATSLFAKSSPFLRRLPKAISWEIGPS